MRNPAFPLSFHILPGQPRRASGPGARSDRGVGPGCRSAHARRGFASGWPTEDRRVERACRAVVTLLLRRGCPIARRVGRDSRPARDRRRPVSFCARVVGAAKGLVAFQQRRRAATGQQESRKNQGGESEDCSCHSRFRIASLSETLSPRSERFKQCACRGEPGRYPRTGDPARHGSLGPMKRPPPLPGSRGPARNADSTMASSQAVQAKSMAVAP